jgi:hypothetical protein
MFIVEYFRAYADKVLQSIRTIVSYIHRLFSAPPKEMPPLLEWSLRGNVPTIKHLIENEHVDINETYSTYGPNSNTALFYAVSYGHKKAIDILMSYGAINSNDIKMIGHCLGLRGNMLLKGSKQHYTLSYESFNERYTLPAITHHVDMFNQIVQQKIHSPHVKVILNSAEKVAMQIVAESFQSYVQTEKDSYLSSAKRYQQDLPMILRCNWPNHTGFAVLYKNRLYVCDRGIKFPPGINCYQIDGEKLKSMPEADLAAIIKKLSVTRNSVFSTIFSIPEFKTFNARFLYSMRMKRQKQLNCTYTNIKRGVGVILRVLQDDGHQPIEIRKIYKAFTRFDRFQTVDEHVEKYRHSPNKQAFEPLLKFLSEKTIFKNELKVALARHILTKLRADPINLTDKEIATAILAIPHSRAKLWDLYSWFTVLESAIFQKGDRLKYFSRLLNVVPSLRAQKRAQTLQAAQMDIEGLAILRYKSIYDKKIISNQTSDGLAIEKSNTLSLNIGCSRTLS